MAINKNTILTRYVIVILFIVFILGLIIYQIVKISIIQGDKWRSLGEKSKIENIVIEPSRGNIYACDGRLMASSLPQYELYFDFQADGYTGKNKRVSSQDSLQKYMRSLCDTFATIIKDKTSETYRAHMMKGLSSKSRQFKVTGKKVSYVDLKRIRKTPFLKLNPGVNGFYTKTFFKRTKPFGSLASRTIGDIYSEKGKGGKNGLELQFDNVLKGVPGIATRQKIRSSFVKYTTQDPIDGMDIHTTIDVNIQDIAEKALVEKLAEVDAESGTVVLMETKTGEVKAISNMMRMEVGKYGEANNAAVSALTEPGSTFKVASMMVALDDGKVRPDEVFFAENGRWAYSNRVVTDHNQDKGGYQNITAAQAIWYSSNIVVAKIIDRAYHNDPKRYVDKLYELGLNTKLDFQIPGTAKPYIKYPGSPTWSKTTLAWMSFGYETQIPPIYILNFYNAIANGGVMVKPHFVKNIMRNGEVMESFDTEVLKKQICTPKTLEIIQQMLLDVVEKGTGKPIKSHHLKIAGKTGTAQVSQGKSGYEGHQVSFCGYFPADKPKYSAIVVIRYPKIGHAGGGTMAGPVFKKIAEQVYAQSLRAPISEVPKDSVNPKYPASRPTFKKDIKVIFDALKLPQLNMDASTGWGAVEAEDTLVQLKPVVIDRRAMPNVLGMGIRDAVYLLENRGLKVVISGSGVVVSQQPFAGTPFVKGDKAVIRLQ